MGLFTRIAGIAGSFFQLGGPSGPALKNNSGSVDARNSADSAYINVRGLDPAIADDLVTKRYGDANYGGSGGGHTGTATVDFGSPPGTNVTSVVVTGQAWVVAGSVVEAFLMADTTVSGATGHNAEEHQLVPLRLTCGNVVAGTGFTIYAETEWRLTSTFQVRWSS